MPLYPKTSGSERAGFHATDVSATPAAIGELRQEFSSWISGTVSTTTARLSDIILAVYEALANTAEHAYPAGINPGEVSITARYSEKTRSLRVAVEDRGTWLPRSSTLPGRGHGIDLIYALCDRPVFTSTRSGTKVDLQWTLFA